MKHILVIGANSGIGKATIELLSSQYKVFTTSRSGCDSDYKMDVCDEDSIRAVAQSIGALDAIINFAGVAISSPVEFLSAQELQKQFDVAFFGLLKIIQNFYPKLRKEGRIINISSMASFGVFPFISPYCASKSAADILLNSFGNETGTTVISIKPGVVKTEFWENSIEVNKINFNNFGEKYAKEREFLIKNAQKNANKGLEPKVVAKVILKALKAKNPKPSYCVGFDAKMAQLSQKLPQGIVNSIVKKALVVRVGSKKL